MLFSDAQGYSPYAFICEGKKSPTMLINCQTFIPKINVFHMRKSCVCQKKHYEI